MTPATQKALVQFVRDVLKIERATSYPVPGLATRAEHLLKRAEKDNV